MATGFTGMDENASLDAKIIAWGTCQLAISSTEPTFDDTVTTGSTQGLTAGSFTQVSGGSYARVSIPTSSWAAAANRLKSNSVDITFSAATADWGYGLQYLVLFDSTGTQVRALFEFDQAMDILNGGTALTISTGGLVLSHEL